MKTTGQDAVHDFDFWFGHWNIRNERLKQRLVGSQDWETFDAVGDCHAILGGIGNMDSFDSNWNGGFRGMSLRLFDLEKKQWSIWWTSSRTGRLEPPVVGVFRDGVGTFEGDDTQDGRPVRLRFTWSHITPTGAHWEQAMSADSGATWETNWRMYMTRITTEKQCHR